MKTERNSSVEIARVIAVIGIVGLHVYGDVHANISFSNKLIEVLYIEIFAMAVPFFIMVSGYYSVSFSFFKLLKLHTLIIYYSLLIFIVSWKLGIEVTKIDLMKSLFPILMNRYWYFCCYFMLVIFLFFFNWVTDHLEKNQFLALIIIWMLVVDSVTVFPIFSLLADHSWKMLFYYMVGRYLKKYGLSFFSQKRSYLIASLCILAITYGANLMASFYFRRGISWFASDRFFLKEICLTFLFYFIVKCKFESGTINSVSRCVPAVYAGEELFRICGQVSFDAFLDKYVLIFLIIGYAVLISVMVFVLESIRRFLFGKLENKLFMFMQKVWDVKVKYKFIALLGKIS